MTRAEAAASRKDLTMANSRGRPTLLTDELTKRICANLQKAISFKASCESEGVLVTTAEKWLASGAEDKASYVPFFEAVTRARARGEIAAHNKVMRGGKGSDGAKFVLERRFRESYGRVDRLEHAGHDGGAVKTETTLAMKLDELSVDHLRRLAEAN